MMVMRSVLVLVVFAGVANAQPGANESIPPPVQRAAPELLSENTALLLSLGGTLTSYTMWGLAQGVTSYRLAGTLVLTGALGTLVAPSFGHWYAGKIFTRGLGLRLGAIGA